MPNSETLKLLDEANHAVFIAEQAIRKEENCSGANQPMFLMRLQLLELIRRYVANLPICNFICSTDFEELGRGTPQEGSPDTKEKVGRLHRSCVRLYEGADIKDAGMQLNFLRKEAWIHLKRAFNLFVHVYLHRK